MSAPTIADMRAAVGLGPEFSDAAVVDAYVASLGFGITVAPVSSIPPDPFATALAALHASPIAVPAIYSATGKPPLTIRVIWAQGSMRSPDKSDRRVADVNEFDLQRSDVAQPVKGATIALTDRFTGQPLTFKINGAPILDAEGLSWNCPAEPA